MKLNGLDIITYYEQNNKVIFTVKNVSFENILSLDGSTLTITTGTGEEYAKFSGYSLTGITKQNDEMIASFERKLDDATEQAILDLNFEMNQMKAKFNMLTSSFVDSEVVNA